jgi:hypothetical protein
MSRASGKSDGVNTGRAESAREGESCLVARRIKRDPGRKEYRKVNAGSPDEGENKVRKRHRQV